MHSHSTHRLADLARVSRVSHEYTTPAVAQVLSNVSLPLPPVALPPPRHHDAMPSRVIAVLAALACTATAQNTPPPPTSGDGGKIETENGDAIGVVEAQATVGSCNCSPHGPGHNCTASPLLSSLLALSATQGKPGHTTYRLALDLANDAANVYTIFGRKGHPMSFPPAFQVSRPFGAHVRIRCRDLASCIEKLLVPVPAR
jgi:hypothetical protein